MKSDMATIHRNLSRLDPQLPSAADMKFGIVVSQWNPQITGALLEGAVRTLRAAGCEEQNIIVKEVPGTFELALGAQYFAADPPPPVPSWPDTAIDPDTCWTPG